MKNCNTTLECVLGVLQAFTSLHNGTKAQLQTQSLSILFQSEGRAVRWLTPDLMCMMRFQQVRIIFLHHPTIANRLMQASCPY